MIKVHRILLASSLAATASLMINAAAFAGSTATVNLSGTVPAALPITLSPAPDAGSLPLTPGNAYTGIKIAAISGLLTNSGNGLKVTVTSASNWRLVSGSNFIEFGGLGEALGADATSSNASMRSPSYYDSNPLQLTRSSSAGVAPASSIFISFTIPPNQAAGTYTGSITFTAYDN
ncbi:hypothetical protein H6F44_22075 [Pseudanabaena sp. FACHB-1277]|uniref:DUF4402 domain-containing protein n=1 Tax=Pseudanabaena cinerea FACHB-1277 TaxID=2949581 RepID=A0A926ZAC4_9CYAN|nr:hypothetical protein [Pseudanabaena cinerea]MBD2152779.1 hypothetical protein [Pseudanabaena cinerea FACHB-1277]